VKVDNRKSAAESWRDKRRSIPTKAAHELVLSLEHFWRKIRYPVSHYRRLDFP